MRSIELIAAERKRQIERAFTADFDDTHIHAELIFAGVAYALASALLQQGIQFSGVKSHIQQMHWPADWGEFEMSENKTENLVKAAALLAAEIDRLQRQK